MKKELRPLRVLMKKIWYLGLFGFLKNLLGSGFDPTHPQKWDNGQKTQTFRCTMQQQDYILTTQIDGKKLFSSYVQSCKTKDTVGVLSALFDLTMFQLFHGLNLKYNNVFLCYLLSEMISEFDNPISYYQLTLQAVPAH